MDCVNALLNAVFLNLFHLGEPLNMVKIYANSCKQGLHNFVKLHQAPKSFFQSFNWLIGHFLLQVIYPIFSLSQRQDLAEQTNCNSKEVVVSKKDRRQIFFNFEAESNYSPIFAVNPVGKQCINCISILHIFLITMSI